MNSEDIGKQIVALREARGFSQKELAERIPVSPATLSRWENGVITPPLSQLEQISKVLGTSINEIFGGDISEYERLSKRFFRLKLISITTAIILILFAILLLVPRYRIIHEQDGCNDDFGKTKTIYVKPTFFVTESESYDFGSKIAEKYSDNLGYDAIEVIFVKSATNFMDESNIYFFNLYLLD